MKISENINVNESESQSQNKRTLAYLKSGKTLTALEALDLFGCLRLSARILELKNQGVAISDEFVKDARTGKRFKRYFVEVMQ